MKIFVCYPLLDFVFLSKSDPIFRQTSNVLLRICLWSSMEPIRQFIRKSAKATFFLN